MPETVEIAVMDKDRAAMICENVRRGMTVTQDYLVELYDGRGWIALGYNSWGEMASAEFGQHAVTLYRRLKAAQVAKELEDDPFFCKLQKTQPVPESQLRALSSAPEGTRAKVLAVANEAANGKPTERTIKAAVEVARESPDSTKRELVKAVKEAVADKPKPSGKTIVNGVEQEDAAVAKARAAGRIPEGVAVTVEDPGDDETDVDDIREEREERAAIEGEITDDEWLATLPLSSQLEGLALKRFRMDALHYRRLETKRRGVIQANGSVVKEVFRGTPWRGHVQASISWWLRMEAPDRWRKCSSPDKGGCDGTGMVPILGGNCDICKGKGYIAR